MNIKEKLELLKRLQLDDGENIKTFTKRVKMSGSVDELYAGGMWDFCYDLFDTIAGCDDELIGVELLYNLLKY